MITLPLAPIFLTLVINGCCFITNCLSAGTAEFSVSISVPTILGNIVKSAPNISFLKNVFVWSVSISKTSVSGEAKFLRTGSLNGFGAPLSYFSLLWEIISFVI